MAGPSPASIGSAISWATSGTGGSPETGWRWACPRPPPDRTVGDGLDQRLFHGPREPARAGRVVGGGVRGPRVSRQAVARVGGALGTRRSALCRGSSGARPRTFGRGGRRGGRYGLFRVRGGLRERR